MFVKFWMRPFQNVIYNIIVLKCRGVVASTADRRRGSEDQLITTEVINDIMSSGGCAVKTA